MRNHNEDTLQTACGAPLHSHTCEYCGTEFRDNSRKIAEIQAFIDSLQCEIDNERQTALHLPNLTHIYLPNVPKIAAPKSYTVITQKIEEEKPSLLKRLIKKIWK